MINQEKNKSVEKHEDRASKKGNESTPVFSSNNSTLQSPEEDRRDKANNPRKNDRLDVSNDDLHETQADRMAGSDRAGTAERKDNQVGNSE